MHVEQILQLLLNKNADFLKKITKFSPNTHSAPTFLQFTKNTKKIKSKTKRIIDNHILKYLTKKDWKKGRDQINSHLLLFALLPLRKSISRS